METQVITTRNRYANSPQATVIRDGKVEPATDSEQARVLTTRHVSNLPASPQSPLTRKDSREGGLATAPRPTVLAPGEAVQARAQSRVRRMCFCALRLVLATLLACGVVALVQRQFTEISSAQAYLNGSVTAVRAPIAGVLRLGEVQPGATVPAGAILFRVDNARFGNVETMSQKNWIEELVDRLRVEAAEAQLRLGQQEELFKHQRILFEDKIISRVVYFEEESKVALARIALNSKKEQLRAAESRGREIEKQLALQKEAVAIMPFESVVWSARVQNGSEVSAHETVLQVIDPQRVWVDAFINERHTEKFRIGTPVMVRAIDGDQTWTGRVESIRGGVGRIDPEQFVAMPAGDLSRRRVAVRVRLESANPFTASEFFGLGRSVKVTPL